MLWLLLLAALALLPFYLDNWFHDRERFELRKAVYVSGWQKWMMENRNIGRFGSIAALYLAMASLSAGFFQTNSTLTMLIYILGAASFLSFLAFQILTHLF